LNTIEDLQSYVTLVKQLRVKHAKSLITNVESGTCGKCGCDGIYFYIYIYIERERE